MYPPQDYSPMHRLHFSLWSSPAFWLKCPSLGFFFIQAKASMEKEAHPGSFSFPFLSINYHLGWSATEKVISQDESYQENDFNEI